MSVIQNMRRQKAVWWQRADAPDRYGVYPYNEPVEIDCRWEDGVGEYRDKVGQVVAAQSTVYVDRVMKVGDKLKRGPIEDDTPTDPEGHTDIFEVKMFEELPNFKATEVLYTARL